jgi:hypothetical protein
MKITFPVLLVAMLVTTALSAQDDKSKRPSPPATTTATIDGKTITIDYSQPSVKGRKVWGGLVPYDEVWRTGANETTTIEVSTDVEIEGQKLAKGKYALFTIPGEKEWVIIINKGIAWGAYDYKAADDVLRVTVTPKASAAFHEKFTIETSPEGVVSLLWENLQVSFKVK